MNNLRNFLVFTFITFFGLLSFQNANAQFTPQHQPFKGIDVKKTIKEPIRIIGKDLVISNAEMVSVRQRGRVNYQVNFTVKNLGSVNVEKETNVLVNIVRYPLNGNGGTVMKTLLTSAAHVDNQLIIQPINGRGTRNYVGYLPNGLEAGFRYQMEIKVDGCLRARDADPCRVREVNENNNNYRLPDITVR